MRHGAEGRKQARKMAVSLKSRGKNMVNLNWIKHMLWSDPE